MYRKRPCHGQPRTSSSLLEVFFARGWCPFVYCGRLIAGNELTISAGAYCQRVCLYLPFVAVFFGFSLCYLLSSCAGLVEEGGRTFFFCALDPES